MVEGQWPARAGRVQGDRVGLCISQLEADQFERGLVAAPGAVVLSCAAVATVSKIRFFVGECQSKARFHGRSAAALCQPGGRPCADTPQGSLSRRRVATAVTVGHETVMATVTFCGSAPAPAIAASPPASFDAQAEYQWQEALATPPDGQQQQWVLLQFDRPVPCPPACRYIASRLDTDLRTSESDHSCSGRAGRT